jgi:diacylglycerol kinase family enzyme
VPGEGTRSVAPSAPPPTERVAVVVNGNARRVNHEVISTLDQILKGGDLFVSRHVKDATEIARTIVSRGYGTVLTGGGDGTFTVVVTEVMREARRRGEPLPRFGPLRLGTGNALAWVMGASQSARKGEGLAADMERLQLDAGSRPLRLIEVEGFVTPFCGLGADAIVLRDYKAVRDALGNTPLRRISTGPSAFALAVLTRTLPGYLVRRVPHCRVINDGAPAQRLGPKGLPLGPTVQKGDVLFEGAARVLSLSTIPFSGFGFRYYPYADDREDRMQLRVSTITPQAFVANFGTIWKGEFDDPEVMFDYLVEAVRIEVDPASPFQIGGDLHGERTSVSARLTSEPIRLVDYYAPPSAK